MLSVTEKTVYFYFEDSDPFIKMAYMTAPEVVEKAIMESDLHMVFAAISNKYGLAACADLVQKAMESVSDEYKKEG